MPLIPVDSSVLPAPSPDIDDRIAAQLAHPCIGWSRETIHKSFLRSWTWARQAEEAAKALSTQLTDVAHIEEAKRIAKRHSGVWRAANKMVKRDAKGKELRSVVPIRADAGDSTCPTWLDREARKRVEEMLPVVTALANLGYAICVASAPNMSRWEAQAIMGFFRNPKFRISLGIHGLDILCVPSSATQVRLLFLAVFKHGAIPPQIDITSDLKLHFREAYDVDSGFYAAVPIACSTLGPEIWIAAQVNRLVDGKRQRDRITFGCLYGQAAENVVKEAAKLEVKDVSKSKEESKLVSDTRNNIASAIAICSKAASAGDLAAAVQARSYARAYAEDLQRQLGNEYPALCLAITYMARYNLSGLADVPVMEHVHTELMSLIAALPKPLNRDTLDNIWYCVEMVKVHSPADLASLAAWMREASTPTNN